MVQTMKEVSMYDFSWWFRCGIRLGIINWEHLPNSLLEQMRDEWEFAYTPFDAACVNVGFVVELMRSARVFTRSHSAVNRGGVLTCVAVQQCATRELERRAGIRLRHALPSLQKLARVSVSGRPGEMLLLI